MAVTVVVQSSSGNPYTIMDLGVGVGSESQGVEWLRSIDGNPMLDGAITPLGSASDGAHYAEVPSPFKDSLQVTNSTAAFISDFGFAWGFGGFDASFNAIGAGSTGISMNNYCKVGKPLRGAIALNMNTNRSDISCTATRYSYATGDYIHQVGASGVYDFHAFFDKSGGCYFFFRNNVPNSVGKLALMDAGSTLLSVYLGELNQLHKYYITDSPYQIKGNVTDAANLPAPGRVVTAYNRETLVPVGNAVTGADGSYQMGLAVKSGASVFVVCLDDDAPPNFEAQVVDRVAII